MLIPREARTAAYLYAAAYRGTADRTLPNNRNDRVSIKCDAGYHGGCDGWALVYRETSGTVTRGHVPCQCPHHTAGQ